MESIKALKRGLDRVAAWLACGGPERHGAIEAELHELLPAIHAALSAQGEAAQPAAEGLAEHTAALSSFLDALDEWGCEDNGERAKAIIQFFNGGCDLSEYEDRPASPNTQGGTDAD